MRTEELASFDARYTLRYVRVFRAPIERVWRAVTTSAELNVWLMPVSRVEAKLGGRVSFSWGGDSADRAASLPAGPDTPWRPGFVAGFHGALDELGEFVIGEQWTEQRIREESARNVERAEQDVGAFESAPDDFHWTLVDRYHEHIKTRCPPR